ncbi:MAG: HIT family protein [Candidatus Aenigmatarchaeota archaeon]
MQECTFCKIVTGKIPAYKIFENEDVMAFLDINPRNPGHTLVIPKRHVEFLSDLTDKEAGDIFIYVRRISEMVRNALKADGISLSLSSGRAAGQVVPHLHFHIIPRFLNEAPPGLESMLPIKLLDKASMEKLQKTIKSSAPEKEEEEFEF